MLKTFSIGGIHPPENKLSAGSKIKSFPIPERVTIPVSQHLGAPARLLVQKGDVVKTGQLLAKGDGFVSANVHSPVTGKIEKIDKLLDSSGFKREAVIIKSEEDTWDELIDTTSEIKEHCILTPEEIIHKISEAGIVGLGGATFPSHVKLSVPKGKKVDCIVINGVECEPYLTSDHALMMEKGQEIIIGVKIIMRALKVKKAIIGIENNKKDAISELKKRVVNEDGISIQELKIKYPQGGEKQLIDAVLNRKVPSGKLPLDVGVVVFNVGTSYAVYEAVQKNKPLIERVITITGEGLARPSNYKVRLGTNVSELITSCGASIENFGKIINGGPMMGKTLSSPEVPVIKGTSGILVIKKENAKRKKAQACIRCSKCISVCPMGLEPFLLMSLSERNLFDRLEDEKVTDCIECGSCSYVCPANRPLLDHIRLGKTQVNKNIRTRKM